MSLCRRRYDNARIINLIKYNVQKREEEVSLYDVCEYNDQRVSRLICEHTDFVILTIISFWASKYMTLSECNKLIDIVEGYYAAYEEGLIDEFNLCNKLNVEIMQNSLRQKTWNAIGYRKRGDDIDFS